MRKHTLYGELDGFLISLDGDILLLPHKTIDGKNRKLKSIGGRQDNKGYMIVSSRKLPTGKVHRLIMLVHANQPDRTLQVNHLNGIKWDNAFENLEWATGKENVQHAIRSGLRNASPSLVSCALGGRNKLGWKKQHEA